MPFSGSSYGKGSSVEGTPLWEKFSVPSKYHCISGSCTMFVCRVCAFSGGDMANGLGFVIMTF